MLSFSLEKWKNCKKDCNNLHINGNVYFSANAIEIFFLWQTCVHLFVLMSETFCRIKILWPTSSEEIKRIIHSRATEYSLRQSVAWDEHMPVFSLYTNLEILAFFKTSNANKMGVFANEIKFTTNVHLSPCFLLKLRYLITISIKISKLK